MRNYDLEFKTKPKERGCWHMTIKAENDKEAIKQVKEMITKENNRYYNCKLGIITYGKKIIWKE